MSGTGNSRLPVDRQGDEEMSFEETYRRYPFSELVRLGLAAAKIIRRVKTWLEDAWAHRRSPLPALKNFTRASLAVRRLKRP